MVGTLDSRLRVQGARPGQVIVLCSWAKQFTSTVPLSSSPRSINGYCWIVEEAWRNAGGNLVIDWNPICHLRGGGVVLFSVSSCYVTGIISGWKSCMAWLQIKASNNNENFIWLQFIFKSEGFNKPFFTTYVKTSSFMVYLTGFLFYEPWRIHCKNCNDTTYVS